MALKRLLRLKQKITAMNPADQISLFGNSDEEKFIFSVNNAVLGYQRICETNGISYPIAIDHHSGICVVLFKGTEEDSLKVHEFIQGLHQK